MALVRCSFFSDSLSLSTSTTVILPQQTTTQIGTTGRATETLPPVLYLLHSVRSTCGGPQAWLPLTGPETSLGIPGRVVELVDGFTLGADHQAHSGTTEPASR